MEPLTKKRRIDSVSSYIGDLANQFLEYYHDVLEYNHDENDIIRSSFQLVSLSHIILNTNFGVIDDSRADSDVQDLAQIKALLSREKCFQDHDYIKSLLTRDADNDKSLSAHLREQLLSDDKARPWRFLNHRMSPILIPLRHILLNIS